MFKPQQVISFDKKEVQFLSSFHFDHENKNYEMNLLKQMYFGAPKRKDFYNSNNEKDISTKSKISINM